MDTTQLQQVLEHLGYEVTFRTNIWTECLATGHEESWTGAGRDRDAASRDLVNRMFPSHGSEALLEKTLEEVDEPRLPIHALDDMVRGLQALRAPVPVPAPAQDETSTVPEDSPEKSQDPPESPLLSTVVEPGPAPDIESEPEPEKVKADPALIRYEPDPRFTKRKATEAENVPETPPETPVEEELSPQMSVEEGLEILHDLVEQIEDEGASLGTMAPTYMRMQVSDWIFQARAVQEQFREPRAPGWREIEDVVRGVARSLTHLCKIYWPGNVHALNVFSTPTQGIEGLVPAGAGVGSWADAQEALSAHMEEVERDTSRDDQGWSDLLKLRPSPTDPGIVVAEARQMVEAVMGPLDGHLDEKRGAVRGDDVVGAMEDLILAAHLLRWTRRCCPDEEEWGRVMGGLRWCAREARGHAKPLETVLDETHVPSKSWAELLGRDPEVNRRKRMQREVLDEAPDSTWEEEDLLAWLRKAFVAFNNPQIAKLAEKAKGEILALSKGDFADADRSTRSRLNRLQKYLRAGSSAKVELPSPDELQVPEDDEETPKPERVDPAARLLEQVRTVTENKRILFVTNRDDVRLRDELEHDLGADVVLKNGGNARQMKSIIDAVDSAKYDIVCMATGFNNHSADRALCRKTKTEGIPYVRVQKGRRAATVRALGRAFNVSARRKPENETQASRTG